MSKGAAKELKRIIALGNVPGNPCPDDGMEAIRDKFERMKSLSDVDKQVIELIQERMTQQRSEFAQRRTTTRMICSKFEDLERICRADREHAELLKNTVEEQQQELVKVRCEKDSLATLNETLRQEVAAKREAYAAIVNRCAEKDALIVAQNTEIATLNEVVHRRNIQNSDACKQYMDSTQTIERLQQERNGLSQELSDIRKRIVEMEAARESNDRQFTEGMQERIGRLELENQELQVNTTRDSLEYRQQMAALKADLQLQTQANAVVVAKLREESDQAKTELDQVRNRMDDEINGHREELARRITDLRELEVNYRCLKDDFENAQIQVTTFMNGEHVWHEKHDELRTQLQDTILELRCCQSHNVELLEGNAKCVDLENRVAQLGNVISYMKQQTLQDRVNLDQEIEIERSKIHQLNTVIEGHRIKEKSSADRVARLCATECEVRAAVAKLLNAQETMEGSFTCLVCMKLFNDAMTCVPCGHVVCRACSSQELCRECCRPTTSAIPNRNMDALTGKFTYSRVVLSKLKEDLSSSPLFSE
uniref:RING-type domain-containing protein n=1 Tax=Spongospora subterranea TaxID=70186 RepID=A0A0H5QNI2_9EUKA|eukprot:CRZ03558.1 hypothetical protein [Spongospora subterranea]